MSQPLYSWGKGLQYPLDRKLGRPQSQSACGGEEKNSQPLADIKSSNPNHPAHSQLL